MIMSFLTPKSSHRQTPPFSRGSREEAVPTLVTIFTVCVVIGVSAFCAWGELGSNVPSDNQLLIRRVHEGGSSGSGIFDIAVPPPGTILQPVQRIPRDRFGVVGPFPLTMQDLQA